MTEYFFDTYAIIEITLNNKNYEKFKEKTLITSILNIGELYMYHLKNYNKKTADYWNRIITPRLIEIDNKVVTEAMLFRLKHKKADMSLVDCIGYVIALRHGLKFLTGDMQFKGLSDVEYVK